MSHTLFRSTRSRVLAVAAAAAVAAPLLMASPSFAGEGPDNPVTGTVSCNTGTGLNTITWTVTNGVNDLVTIEAANLTGAITGPVETWSLEDIPVDDTSTATTVAPAGTLGAVVITVNTSWVDGEFPMDGVSNFTVNLTVCTIATTTTTSTSTTSTSTTSTTAPSTTTTTTAKPAVAVVVATPRFTG